MKQLVFVYAEDTSRFNPEENTVVDISVPNQESLRGQSFASFVVTDPAAEFYKSGGGVCEEFRSFLLPIYGNPNLPDSDEEVQMLSSFAFSKTLLSRGLLKDTTNGRL